MSIKGPKHPEDHPDRIFDCELAMEPLFHAMAVEALAAGWTEDDVANAMLNLSAAQIRDMAAERRTSFEMDVARQMITAMKSGRRGSMIGTIRRPVAFGVWHHVPAVKAFRHYVGISVEQLGLRQA